MRTKGYSSWFVCQSVCVCVLMFILTLRLRGGLVAMPSASELCKPENSDFPEPMRLRDMPWKQEKKPPICIITLGLPWPDPLTLCTLESQEVTTKGMCINSRMLFGCVASPCHTLRKLLVWRPQVNAYSWPNPSISGTAHLQCAEGLHVSAFHYIMYTSCRH